MGKWIATTLGNLITFHRGYDLPKTKMQGGDYPVVGSTGIIGFHNQFTTDNPSITIGRSGTVGHPFIYYGKTWAHNTTLFVQDFKDNDPTFIYYLLKVLPLSQFAGGSAVPTLNRNHLSDIHVTIPSDRRVQNKLGRFLRTFDEKISVNKRINDNLAA